MKRSMMKRPMKMTDDGTIGDETDDKEATDDGTDMMKRRVKRPMNQWRL